MANAGNSTSTKQNLFRKIVITVGLLLAVALLIVGIAKAIYLVAVIALGIIAALGIVFLVIRVLARKEAYRVDK